MTTPVPAPAPTPVAPAKPTFVQVLTGLLTSEPALITTVLNTAAALIAAFAVGVTQTEQSAIVVIGGALVTLLTAALTRPVKVAVLAGAVTTGLTAAAAFGLKLSAEDLSIVATVLTLASSLAIRVMPDVFSLASVRLGRAAVGGYRPELPLDFLHK